MVEVVLVEVHQRVNQETQLHLPHPQHPQSHTMEDMVGALVPDHQMLVQVVDLVPVVMVAVDQMVVLVAMVTRNQLQQPFYPHPLDGVVEVVEVEEVMQIQLVLKKVDLVEVAVVPMELLPLVLLEVVELVD